MRELKLIAKSISNKKTRDSDISGFFDKEGKKITLDLGSLRIFLAVLHLFPHDLDLKLCNY